MRDRLCHPGPELREFINVFVDGEQADLDVQLTPDSVVYLMPAMAGGATVPVV
jgi:molybdopterin converting factor small subunit